jgi:hypothetical protein
MRDPQSTEYKEFTNENWGRRAFQAEGQHRYRICVVFPRTYHGIRLSDGTAAERRGSG